MANRKKAKQARKNHGMGFINPPYQNGQNSVKREQTAKPNTKVLNRKNGTQR